MKSYCPSGDISPARGRGGGDLDQFLLHMCLSETLPHYSLFGSVRPHPKGKFGTKVNFRGPNLVISDHASTIKSLLGRSSLYAKILELGEFKKQVPIFKSLLTRIF